MALAAGICAFTLAGSGPGVDAADELVTVTKVVDGDTFEAHYRGETRRIRMLGINSTEAGECHAQRAKEQLQDLIEGKQVRISSDDPNVELRARPARFVDIGDLDVGASLLSDGIVLPYTHTDERSRNEQYLTLALEAADNGIGIWDDDACGAGPSQDAGLQLHVRWDAQDNDSVNVNGEWVDVYNPSSSPVSLDGWWLRDSSTRYYHFPNGTVVEPGRYVRVHIGRGTDGSVHKYWGLDHPIFTNDISEATFLFDPDGDLRAHFVYPCRSNCSPSSSLRLDVNYIGVPGVPLSEYVDVTNRSTSRVQLYGLRLVAYPIAYHFDTHHSIPAGGTIRVWMGPGTDTASNLYLGLDRLTLNNSGDSVSIETHDGAVLTAYTWPFSIDCSDAPTTSTASGAGPLRGAATASATAVRTTFCR